MKYAKNIIAFLKPAVALLVVAGLTYWGFTTLNHNKKTIEEKAELREEVIQDVPVRVGLVQKLLIDNKIILSGQFEARQELNIIAESQGRITNLYIEEGQYIKKGAVVAKIDDTNIQAQLLISKASAEKASKDVERFERLVGAGAVSQQQLEEVRLGFQNAQANVTAMEQQLKYSIAHSPMSGIVKVLNIDQGSFASPGMTMASVIDATRLRMVVKVGEMDIIKIKYGQKVKVRTDVYPNIAFDGRVKLISVQADAARKYEVAIDINSIKNAPLKPGMYGVVEITPQTKSDDMGLFVARKAIVGSVQEPMVYVLGKDNEATYKTVQVGKIMGDKVQVLSGLTEGDEVVTTGQINISDGQKVKVIENNSDTSHENTETSNKEVANESTTSLSLK